MIKIKRQHGQGQTLLEIDVDSLKGVDLSHASLPDAKFWYEDLAGANMSGADLTAAGFIQAKLVGADLSGAKLAKATFVGADLTNADLSAANLAEADFQNATLVSANLSEANLSAAKLHGADLKSADITNAVLSDIKLRPSAKDSVKGLAGCLGLVGGGIGVVIGVVLLFQGIPYGFLLLFPLFGLGALIGAVLGGIQGAAMSASGATREPDDPMHEIQEMIRGEQPRSDSKEQAAPSQSNLPDTTSPSRQESPKEVQPSAALLSKETDVEPRIEHEISFVCPSCDQHMVTDQSMAGNLIECPSCGKELTVSDE